MKPNILKNKKEYIIEYPTAVEFCEAQDDIFWTEKEVALEKDLHSLKTELTESELHGVVTVLKLFTEYELRVGSDYWLGRFMRIFKRPELQRMAATFGSVELGVHAPFYSKINELLGLNTEEFYREYQSDKVLVDRLEAIESVVGLKIADEYDILKSLGAFSVVEGAILYSNFAFLKHFQAEGKNKLINLVAGINFSVRDEDLHSLGGAWVFRTLLEESNLTDKQKKDLEHELYVFAMEVADHEALIVDMIFEKGAIKGITPLQLNNFVESRINLCLKQLGYEGAPYTVSYNPISDWFYKNIQSSQMHDFFVKQGNSYNRDWREGGFEW